MIYRLIYFGTNEKLKYNCLRVFVSSSRFWIVSRDVSVRRLPAIFTFFFLIPGGKGFRRTKRRRSFFEETLNNRPNVVERLSQKIYPERVRTCFLSGLY